MRAEPKPAGDESAEHVDCRQAGGSLRGGGRSPGRGVLVPGQCQAVTVADVEVVPGAGMTTDSEIRWPAAV